MHDTKRHPQSLTLCASGLCRLVAFGLAVVSFGCGRASDQRTASSGLRAISNQPQAYSQFITVIRLREPALLASLTPLPVQAGSQPPVLIDPARRAAVAAEQEAAIAQLRALDPDVRILYRYELVLNALAVVAPRRLETQLRSAAGASYMETGAGFHRQKPLGFVPPAALVRSDGGRDGGDPVRFTGARRVQRELGLSGQGVRIGVIDSGIDYTHAMFGGAGTPEAYKAVDPSRLRGGEFPTAAIPWGRDLVGSDYDSNAVDFNRHVPQPDANPLDEGGHGTHVAGTIAGTGDGLTTYSGVAPEAKLYALKVFGRDGSSGDEVILAALELAADPTQQHDPSRHLDVVNLSIAADFGSPHVLYNEAVANLSRAGTTVVAAAGNSGALPYVVGAPATASAALSVAASVDDTPANTVFPALQFVQAGALLLTAPGVPAGFAKGPLGDDTLHGSVVAVGTARQPLGTAPAAQVRGHVALVDQADADFYTAAKHAVDAGATGVIGINATPGLPISPEGDTPLPVPVLLVAQAVGARLHAALAAGLGDIQVTGRAATNLASSDGQRIDRSFVDSVADFSSRGPRSLDSLLKPEITAPGVNITSAAMGSGSGGLAMSGTSMAAPYMTGVMALLHEAHPDLSVEALKAVAMATALPLVDPLTKLPYPLSVAGAGRVDAYGAATAELVALPGALSLGEVGLAAPLMQQKVVTLRNLSATPLTLSLAWESREGMRAQLPASLTLAAHAVQTLSVAITMVPPKAAVAEYDGAIVVRSGARTYRVPVLAMVHAQTQLAAADLRPVATGPDAAPAGALVLRLNNQGPLPATALLFNLLAQSPPVLRHAVDLGDGILTPGPDAGSGVAPETARDDCAPAAAGWRLRQAGGHRLLEVAVHLAAPLTTWQLCEISLQFDGTGAGDVRQELIGTRLATLTQDSLQASAYVSALTDVTTMRAIRKGYETGASGGALPSYAPAIQARAPFLTFDHAATAVLAVDYDAVVKTPTGGVRFRIAALGDDSNPVATHYLGDGVQPLWFSVAPQSEPYTGLPAAVEVAGQAAVQTAIQRQVPGAALLVLTPGNRQEAVMAAEAQVVWPSQ